MESLILTSNVKFTIIGIYTILSLFSVIVFLKNLLQKDKDFTNLNQRIKSFWIITPLFTFAILGNKLTAFILVGLISYLAFKEYISIIPTRKADRRVLLWAYLSIPIQLYICLLYTSEAETV